MVVPLAALAVLLGGCVGRFASDPARPAPAEISLVALERAAVMAQASDFMQRFRRGAFAAQWQQLAPPARSMWRSRQARDAMLVRKFGQAGIGAVRVGPAAAGATWTDGEDPRLTIPNLWRVSVGVSFQAPERLAPGGVASNYAQLDLYLSIRSPRGPAQVVGEGPASIDAPVIVPPSVPAEAVRVPILMYHLVGPLPSPQQWTDAYGYRIEYGLTVPPAQFAGEMAYLAGHGYHAISLTRLADALLYELPLPAKPFVISFDDGRESPWQYAVPVLRHYGFTATFFICSGFVGQTNQTADHRNVQTYLSWSQIASLAGMGFAIEDHGQKDIKVLWNLSPGDLRTEVGQSAQQLTAHTGQPVQFLAYTGALWPYPLASDSGPDQQALFPRLAALGYAGAVTDTRVPSTQEQSQQLFQLPRVRVSPGESLPAFAASLGG